MVKLNCFGVGELDLKIHKGLITFCFFLLVQDILSLNAFALLLFQRNYPALIYADTYRYY